MSRLSAALLSTVIVGLSLGLAAQSAPPKSTPARPVAPPKPAVSHPQASQPAAADAQPTLVKQYCVGCHNDKAKTGGLTLASFDPSRPDQNAEVAEKMIRKLRLGMMPPPGVRRPDAAVVDTFVTSLETKIDAAAAVHPNPGRRTFQRLNRAEYQRAVHDLLDLDVDVNAFLPPDTMSGGYDNIADVQGFSPTLMEGYLRAAAKISGLAVGDKNASPSESTYKVPRTQSQMHHIDGTPWGTRGGISVTHTFPADGEYTFRIMLHGTPTGQLFGSVARRDEQLEVSINGERVALLDVNWRMSETDKAGLNLLTPRIFVKAGPQHLAAAFIQKFDGVIDDLMAPIDYTLSDTEYGDNAGIYVLPHVRDFSITGPLKVTGVSETPSRRRIFLCRPLSPADEIPCARRIVENLASEAYRRPAHGEDVESLMEFYADGRKGHDFELGIKLALQAILASPKFVFRFEAEPTTIRAGQAYRLSDLDLASRLSFFLWDTVPDAELVKVANAGTLHVPAVLEKQVRRMLNDPKAEALSTRFASQWLKLQDVEKLHPDALLFPSFDNELTQSYVRETQLFFNSIVREDRNILDLLTADYSFINERIAKVYRIPNIVGGEFRRVTMPPERRGILGQGSILMQTAVADRTSPVQRGKWIMETLLGSPPPPPPPNVPAFDETSANMGGKPLSVRERMEEHRKNPMCASCHRVIDPIGLSLENFDTIGAWRIKDNGVDVDTTGTLYDGTKITGPAGLREALLARSEAVIRNFTDNLMSYALGRRIEYYDQPTIRAIVKKAAAGGNKFSSFVFGIVNSPAFQMSTADVVTTTAQEEPR
jgi:mono/diheme cytochrome c family protein